MEVPEQIKGLNIFPINPEGKGDYCLSPKLKF